tara:strand:- start:2215 stop:2619 length:405 start_codon:yes stop_codon:yes gene_type:complete
MTNFNTEIHDKVKLLSRATETILNTNIRTLSDDKKFKRRNTRWKMMMSMLNGSHMLFKTVSDMVTTEVNQSAIVLDLIDSLDNTFITCNSYGVSFDGTDELMSAWNSGHKWCLKQEGNMKTVSPKNVLNLFDHE